MATLGEKLKNEREARGVSINEIAATTRINPKFIEGLENDDYSEFPAAVFVIGFLRSYAKHLGLDVEKIVAEYEMAGVEIPKESNASPMVDLQDNRISVTLVILALISVLIFYVGYKNWDKFESLAAKPEKAAEEPDKTNDFAPPAPASTPEPVVPEPVAVPEPVVPEPEEVAGDIPAETDGGEDAPEEPLDTEAVAADEEPAVQVEEKPVEEAQAEPDEKPVSEPSEQSAPSEEEAVQPVEPTLVAKEEKEYPELVNAKYKLVVSATTEDVWILVVIDDDIVRDMFVRAGQTRILKGNRSFLFTTGNAPHAKVSINGQPLEMKVPPSGVLRNWQIPLPE